MDSIRTPFKALYRMYPDDEPVELTWFFAHPDAQVFYGATPFHAAGNYEQYCPLGLHETGEVTPVRRRYGHFPRPPGLDGRGPIDGTEEDFRGRLPRPADGTFDVPDCLSPQFFTFDGEDVVLASASCEFVCPDETIVDGGRLLFEATDTIGYIVPDLIEPVFAWSDREFGDLVSGLVVVGVRSSQGGGGPVSLSYLMGASAVERSETQATHNMVLSVHTTESTAPGAGLPVSASLVLGASALDRSQTNGSLDMVLSVHTTEVTAGPLYGLYVVAVLTTQGTGGPISPHWLLRLDASDLAETNGSFDFVVSLDTVEGCGGPVDPGLVLGANASEGGVGSAPPGLVLDVTATEGHGVIGYADMILSVLTTEGSGCRLSLARSLSVTTVEGCGVSVSAGMVFGADAADVSMASGLAYLVVELDTDETSGADVYARFVMEVDYEESEGRVKGGGSH